MDGIWWDIGPYTNLGLFERVTELCGSVSTEPRWMAGLPAEAIISRCEVPEPRRGRSMTFEARWRAVTMARLYSRCGWTFKRIGAHFGVGPERVRQLVRLAGYRGRRGSLQLAK